jgi:Domain of unknown function (DUF305)
VAPRRRGRTVDEDQRSFRGWTSWPDEVREDALGPCILIRPSCSNDRIGRHRGAIEMAEQEQAEGSNPDARALAGTIIEAQTAEIAQMQTLLAGL